LERLLVLTGGVAPQQCFSLTCTEWLSSPKASSKIVRLADLVFTEAGLMVLPYAEYQSAQTIAASATGFVLAGPLGGMAAGLVSQGLHGAGVRKARKKSKQLSLSERHLTPMERFARRGSFFPADEVLRWRKQPQPSRDYLVHFWFRHRPYAFVLGKNEQVSYEQIIEWHRAASEKRQALAGASSDPGIISLLEWGQRPEYDRPDWLLQAIANVYAQSRISVRDKELATMRHFESLIARLLVLGPSQARSLARKLEASRMTVFNRMAYIGGAIGVASLVGIAACLLSLDLNRNPNRVILPITSVLGAIWGAVICVWGLFGRCGIRRAVARPAERLSQERLLEERLLATLGEADARTLGKGRSTEQRSGE
jgi:hypothetical protein